MSKILQRLTKSQKIAIHKKKRKNPTMTQQALAKWASIKFGLKKAPTQATISNILANNQLYMLGLKERDDGESDTLDIEEEDERIGREKKLIRFKSEVSILQIEVWLLAYICERAKFPSDTRLRKKARHFMRKVPFDIEDPSIFTLTWVKTFRMRYGLLKEEEKEREEHFIEPIND